MFVHIDPETLKQHPWIGVLIGLAGVGLIVFFGPPLVSEYMKLSRLSSPELITVATATLGNEQDSRWVTLQGGTPDCQMAAQVQNKFPESLIFGKISDTQVARWEEPSRNVVVVSYDGEISCTERAAQPVTGMLIWEGNDVWHQSIRQPVTAGRSYDKRFLLVEGAGPERARNYTLFASIMFIAFSAFTIYYLRLWMSRSESPAHPYAP